ncbi:MAG: hypothetical protein J7J91_01335 [Deltaproteobacteria bacterium]|nr:hypothetical protein [Deltaproteobacteria bacterium]
MCVRECEFPYFLLTHYKGAGRKRYQKCVRFVGITANEERFGEGVILPATVQFKFPVRRYTPTTEELSKLVASFCLLYGDFFWEDFISRVKKHYWRMVRMLDGVREEEKGGEDGNA